MMLHKRSLLAGLLVLAAASAASAVTTATVSVNGAEPISIPLEGVDKSSYYCAGSAGCSSPAITGDGYSITIDALLDPDPVIDYGMTVVNNTGGALAISVLLSQSITLTTAPGSVNTSMSGSTTNGGGGAGLVTVTPLGSPVPTDSDGIPEIQVFTLSTDGGGSLSNADIDLGTLFNSNPALTSDTHGPFNSAIIAGPIPAGLYDFMRLDLNFSVSGSGDTYTFNGSARVVPEPETAVLMLLGLFGLGYFGRRRSA